MLQVDVESVAGACENNLRGGGSMLVMVHFHGDRSKDAEGWSDVRYATERDIVQRRILEANGAKQFV